MVNFQIKKVRSPIAADAARWEDTTTKWLATINGQKFTYWTGFAITDTPTYDDVLSCLLQDTIRADQTYQQFCDEFCYNVEDKDSKRIYKACQENTKKLILAGVDLEAERTKLLPLDSTEVK